MKYLILTFSVALTLAGFFTLWLTAKSLGAIVAGTGDFSEMARAASITATQTALCFFGASFIGTDIRCAARKTANLKDIK
jgi:hypothetical protein